MGSYPLLNIAAENFTFHFRYKLSGENIIVEKGFHFTPKHVGLDIIAVLLYVGSITTLYLDASEKDSNEDNSNIMESIAYGAATAICTASYNYFTTQYGKKYDHDIVTYVSNVYGLPLRIAAAFLGYLTINSMKIEDDFENNAFDLLPSVGLSLVYLASIYFGNYVFSVTEHFNSTLMLMVTTLNMSSLLLEKNFDYNNFTIYSAGSTLLIVASCSLIMLNDMSKANDRNDVTFVDLILKKADVQNIEQIKQNIIDEWNLNIASYEPLVDASDLPKLNMEYNELLLVIISKVLGTNCVVNGEYTNNQFIIRNSNNLAIEGLSKNLTIKLNFPLDDKFNQKLINVSSSEVSIRDLGDPVGLNLQGDLSEVSLLLGNTTSYYTFDE